MKDLNRTQGQAPAPAPRGHSGDMKAGPISGVLRTHYDRVLSEPIPDRLMEILDRLRRLEK